MHTQIIRPPTPIKPGIMMIWPTDVAPAGWLLCYGQAISRTGYAGLFNAIGTTFGIGDGSTTFNLPDYRGRIPLGKDNMGGVSANRVTNAQADTIGGAEGAENNTLTAAQMPAHVHTGPSHTHEIQKSTINEMQEGSDDFKYFSGGGSTNTGAAGTGNTGLAGSSSSHNNMTPYLTLNYIIKI